MSKKITEKVTWVGKVDWELTHFHGDELSTFKGSSYNSYLIKDKKTVLIDTVWGPYDREFVARLKEVVDLKTCPSPGADCIRRKILSEIRHPALESHACKVFFYDIFIPGEGLF